MPPADVVALLHPLPVRALWGVGPKTAQTLESLGLSTVGEIAAVERATLIRHLGKAAGGKLHDLANGLDERSVETESTEQSIGAETTFAVDTADREFLRRELLGLAERTARRAREAGARGRTVALKVRYEDFSTVTRSITLATPTDLSGVIHATATGLLDKLGHAAAGCGCSVCGSEGLVPADQVSEQLELGAARRRPGLAGSRGRAGSRDGPLRIARGASRGPVRRPEPPIWAR